MTDAMLLHILEAKNYKLDCQNILMIESLG